MPKKQVIPDTQSRGIADASLVSASAAPLTSLVSEKQDARFAKHLAHLRAEKSAGRSEKDLAERYGCDSAHIHRLLAGTRPLSAKFAARVAELNPAADFVYEPPEPTVVEPHTIMAEQAAAASSHDAWLKWRGSLRGIWIRKAKRLLDEVTPELTLLGSELYSAVWGSVERYLPADCPWRVLPEPPQEGPTVELQRALIDLRALVAEASERRNVATRELDGLATFKLQNFVASTEEKLGRLSRTVTAAQLITGEPWQRIAARLCDALRYVDDERSALADMLDRVNDLGADLARQLRLVRHLVFPCSQYANDPVGFVRDVLGVELHPGQIEILLAICEHRRVTIRSGNKGGKTFALACAILWFYATRADATVIITAPTVEQVSGQLWHEVSRLFARSGVCLDCRRAGVTESPCPHSQKLGVDSKILQSCHGESGGIRAKDGRRVFGRCASDAGGILGFGGADLLIVCDESSELPEDQFVSWEFCAAADRAKFVLAGNPIRLYNSQWNTFFGDIAQHWHPVHLDCEAMSQYSDRFPGLMSRAEIEIAASLDRLKGRNSDEFRARVLGEFPLQDIELALAESDIALCHQRWAGMPDDGPLTIGWDPGSDKDRGDPAGFCVRRGCKIVELYEKKCTIEEAVRVEINDILGKWARPTDLPIPIRFDRSSALGVAAEQELLRLLRESGPNTLMPFPIMPGAKSTRLEFAMWRDYLLHQTVAAVIEKIGVMPNNQLDDQLRLIRSSQKLEDDKSITSYMPKHQFRTRLKGASPNLLDALSYCVSNLEQDYGRTPQGRAEARSRQYLSQQYNQRSFGL